MSFKRDPNTIPSPIPHDYDRQRDFTEHEAGNPNAPRPGTWLDNEFDEVERALDETQDRLALIQRDDGALQNESVSEDTLAPGLLEAIVQAWKDADEALETALRSVDETIRSEYKSADDTVRGEYAQADAAVKAAVRAEYRAADANIQAQMTGEVPLEASAFSPVSWHDQVVESSLTIPDNKNAWSFGPSISIAAGASVTIGANSFWTIANGAQQ